MIVGTGCWGVMSLNTLVPYSRVLRNIIYIVATVNRNRKYLIGSEFREDCRHGPGDHTEVVRSHYTSLSHLLIAF